MRQTIWGFWALLLASSFIACIRTEIVPEFLTPKLAVTPQTASLVVGETLQLNGLYTDEAANDLSGQILWQSAAPGTATVDAAGLVTAVAVGQTWIIASAPQGLADSTLVTVAADASMVGTVSITTATSALVVGQSAQLQASVQSVAGTELPGEVVTWQTSNAAVLSVNETGRVTAAGEGAATVTAAVGHVMSLPRAITVTPVGGSTRSGSFAGNLGYSVSGTATLRQTGSTISLVLESNFATSNGPGLFVYLAKTAAGSLNSQNSISLGNLQSTSGIQTYAVPASVSLTDFDYVVIYCLPFTVRFGTAQLQ